MKTLILVIFITVVTVLLFRIAVIDTERAKNHKKFLKDMEEFDNKKLKFKK